MLVGARARVRIDGGRDSPFKAQATDNTTCDLGNAFHDVIMNGSYQYPVDVMVVVYEKVDSQGNTIGYGQYSAAVDSTDWLQAAIGTDTESVKEQVVKEFQNNTGQNIIIDNVYLANSNNNPPTVDPSTGEVTGNYLFRAVVPSNDQVVPGGYFKVTMTVWLTISSSDGSYGSAGEWLTKILAGVLTGSSNAKPNDSQVYDNNAGGLESATLTVSDNGNTVILEIDYEPSSDTTLQYFKYRYWDDQAGVEEWAFTFTPSTAPNATGGVTNTYKLNVAPPC